MMIVFCFYKAARGGVLFIDEAYELGKGHYSDEAMTSLVSILNYFSNRISLNHDEFIWNRIISLWFYLGRCND